MSPLQAYALGALVFLAVMLAGVLSADVTDAQRRRMVLLTLRDAVIWPVGFAYLTWCLATTIAELGKDGDL